jgi:hypothetical protein
MESIALFNLSFKVFLLLLFFAVEIKLGNELDKLDFDFPFSDSLRMFKFTFGSLALLSLLVLCCRGSTDQTIFGLSKGFDDAEFMKNYVCDKNHNYTVRVVLRDPLIMEIDNFLAPGEADHLIMLGQPLMKQSGLVDDENNNPDLTVRSSFSAFLERSQDDVVSCIEQRMSYFSNKPTPNIEPLQIVWYRNQQEYKPVILSDYDFT